jgi:nitrogenase-stabilizing/protective protein
MGRTEKRSVVRRRRRRARWTSLSLVDRIGHPTALSYESRPPLNHATGTAIKETIMTDDDFDLDLEELSSAEDFLTYFEIDFDPAVVHVNRLHILQRFHDYLEQVDEMPDSGIARRVLYADLLASAYRDFVDSDAATEKVFRVFRMNEPKSVRVALSDLTEQMPHAARL